MTNSRKRPDHSILQLFLVLRILFGRELWIWVLVASEEGKVSEKSTGTNGLLPAPPTEGCCLNPGVFGELKPQCWLTETILSGLISSISQWRVPIQCSPLLLCCDLCHPPIYRTVSGQFLSWKVSLRLFHPPSPTPSLPLPTSLSSLFCSVCCCWSLIARSQHWHTVIPPTPPPPNPDFIMCWNLFLSTSSTWSLPDLYYSVCVGHVWWKLIINVNIHLSGAVNSLLAVGCKLILAHCISQIICVLLFGSRNMHASNFHKCNLN